MIDNFFSLSQCQSERATIDIFHIHVFSNIQFISQTVIARMIN